MRMTSIGRIGAFVATLGVSAGLVGVAAHTTGAYFSDTHQGSISGTVGSIKITTGNTTLSFSNLLPGEQQSQAVSYQNSGRNAEDVYLVFSNPDALHALNTLGTYGEVHVSSNGTEIFASQNLNDNTTSCPPGSHDATHAPCAALPSTLKLASNVGPGQSGNLSFAFNYASKLGNGANADGATGPAWNCYPVVSDTTSGCGANPSYGLPFQIVATQVGVAPGS